MRTIDTPGSFKRDFKRESKGQHRATLDIDLKPVIDTLVFDHSRWLQAIATTA